MRCRYPCKVFRSITIRSIWLCPDVRTGLSKWHHCTRTLYAKTERSFAPAQIQRIHAGAGSVAGTIAERIPLVAPPSGSATQRAHRQSCPSCAARAVAQSPAASAAATTANQFAAVVIDVSAAAAPIVVVRPVDDIAVECRRFAVSSPVPRQSQPADDRLRDCAAGGFHTVPGDDVGQKTNAERVCFV